MKISVEHCSAAAAIFVTGLYFGTMRLGIVHAGQEAKSTSAPAGNAENGQRLFNKNGCYECHGREGQGSVMTGPRIAPDPPPYEVISSYIRKPRGEMPPYTEKVLPDKDLADIYAFLQSRPHPPTAKAMPLFK